MIFKLGVGESDFATLRREQSYYVDKTEIIYDLVNNTDNKVTLFTRPRRFGKTLMMSMMENFFNIRKDSKALFEGLNITKHTDFCNEWMNRYPVLSVSFKDVEAENFNEAYDMLGVRIADICKGVANLADHPDVDVDDKAVFGRLKSETAKKSDIKNSVKTIMRMMTVVYKKPVILLIDEYDVPLAMASEKDTEENAYYPQMLDVIRGIMGTALKDNDFLQFAVVTGCLRIAKESIFTGTNNFAAYSVLDRTFSSYFGFSEDEVSDMLVAADRSDMRGVAKQWYDGYIFGDSYVYCPWDVINYISALKTDQDIRPKNYWKNTSHNGILRTFVGRTDFDVTGKYETLLNGGTIVSRISDEMTYDTLHSSEDNLWSVLLMTGYVTKADPSEDGDFVSLRIPNREITSIFEDTVVSFFSDTVNDGKIKGLMNAFWDSDEARASEIMSELLWDTISYNDYHEDYYHAFLTGIFVGRGYSVESNKEMGLGRPDIILKDRKNRRALIIEAKKSEKKESMDKDCEAALNQISTQKYAEGLTGYEQIFCFGVAFYQKQACVKKRL